MPLYSRIVYAWNISSVLHLWYFCNLELMHTICVYALLLFLILIFFISFEQWRLLVSNCGAGSCHFCQSKFCKFISCHHRFFKSKSWYKLVSLVFLHNLHTLYLPYLAATWWLISVHFQWLLSVISSVV